MATEKETALKTAEVEAQQLPEIQTGKDIIVAIRLFEDLEKESASLLMYETENSDPKKRSFDTIKTKSGNVINPGDVEYAPKTKSYVPIGSKDVEKYETAFDEVKLIEFWRINKSEKGEKENTFKATYKQGYIVNFEKSAGVDGLVELNMEFAINGRERKGDATLTAKQVSILENQYDFVDTLKGGGE